MKKQLSLLALLALGTPIAFAGNLQLDQVFDQELGFGYTENQNILVEGFQITDDTTTSEFLLKTPILKDAKDSAVGEYYVLLGEKPIKDYVAWEEAQMLRNNLLELPVYSTMDIEGQVDLKIDETMINSGTTYFGVVVPVDDNVLYGKYSKEFCFNFSTQKYAEGEACSAMAPQPEAVQVVVADDELSNVVAEEDAEHDAAGADMRLADISHSVQGNVVTLTWTAVPGSENVEIKIFDKEKADYVTLGTVPMTQETFEYTYDDTIQELLFAFIPRDTQGKEIRYDVNVRHEADVTPEITTTPKVGPVEDMMMIVAFTLLAYAGYRVVARRKAS